jgi:23S rRNA (guanosine2251-2'-O)-methyltransferase
LERIYGLHPVKAALGNPDRRIEQLWVSDNTAGRLEPALGRAVKAGIRLESAGAAEISAKCEPGAVHQGCLLEARPLVQPPLDELCAAGGLLVVLDKISDPHNIGAIVRSAAAFGAGGLVTTRRAVPQITPSLAKSASGALEHIPFVRVANLARALETMGQARFRIVGLDSGGDISLSRCDLTRPLALVLGAEGTGLRRLTSERCDVIARLDMPGPIKSLNVSNAAAVALSMTCSTPAQ